MEDTFDLLADDHEEIRQMLSELEKGPTLATGATEDQLMLRSMMTEELVIEESKHEAVEQRYFWPAVREHVAGGDRLADQAICQELEIGELLAQLSTLDAGDARFEPVLAQFIKAGREHFDFEESQVWPALRAALTPKAAAKLGSKILLGKRTQPGRVSPPMGASTSPE
jgi:hemerythrin-like domain-containing protein